MKRFFLIFIFLSFSSASFSQWLVDGGNLVWPYGNATVNGVLYSNGFKSLKIQPNLTVTWWDSTLSAFRIFVDGLNGNDNNDGATWSTAKKTFQAALDILPSNSYGFIAFTPGTYTGGILPPIINTKIELWRVDYNYNTTTSGLTSWFKNGETIPTIPADTSKPLEFISDGSKKFFSYGLAKNCNLLIGTNGADDKQKWGMFKVTILDGGLPAIRVWDNSLEIRHAVFDASANVTLQDAPISFWRSSGFSIISSLGMIGNTSNPEYTTRGSGWRAFISLRGDPGNVSIGNRYGPPSFNSSFLPPNGKAFDIKTVNSIIADWYGGTTEFKTNGKNTVVNLLDNVYVDNSALNISSTSITVTEGTALDISVNRSVVDILSSGVTNTYRSYSDPVNGTLETFVSENIKDEKLSDATSKLTLSALRILLNNIPSDSSAVSSGELWYNITTGAIHRKF